MTRATPRDPAVPAFTRKVTVMGPEWIAIIALVALFVVGTVLPINIGALAYVAAWFVGMYALDLDEKEIIAGVSGDLILTLIGVTWVAALAVVASGTNAAGTFVYVPVPPTRYWRAIAWVALSADPSRSRRL